MIKTLFQLIISTSLTTVISLAIGVSLADIAIVLGVEFGVGVLIGVVKEL
jgi:hypothetical protein